jgi:hypothetical protein
MTVDRWLAAAIADAERRGMPDLKPLLEGLATATTALRAADWNDRGDADTGPMSATSEAREPEDR